LDGRMRQMVSSKTDATVTFGQLSNQGSTPTMATLRKSLLAWVPPKGCGKVLPAA
jgi:hypothetical protein